LVEAAVIARTPLLIEKHDKNNDRTQDNQTYGQPYDGFVRSSGLDAHFTDDLHWFFDDWLLFFVCHL
jgi:hypothetical protein